MSRSLLITLTALLVAPVARAELVTLAFDLQTPTVTGTTAVIPVRLVATGGPADAIEVIQLSVYGSSPALTAGGTDFSRFTFLPDAAGLTGWLELVPLSAGGLNLLAPSDPLAGPFVTPAGTIPLGTLSVDLTGLSGSHVVTLAGGPPGLGTDAGGTAGGSLVPSFAADPLAGRVTFAQPDGVAVAAVVGPTPEPTPVPAPAGLLLLGTGAAALLGWRIFPRKSRSAHQPNVAEATNDDIP